MSPPPRVSVVIPAYHSDRSVADCLEALRRQTFRDFETILVNSSPEERTGEIVTTRFPEVLFEQSASRLLPHAARNRGVRQARGELLVFTDPDCRARRDWLARLVDAHDAGHEVVGGAMGLQTGRWLERAVHLSKFSWLLSGLSAGPRAIVCTANASYARSVWDRVGPFEDDLFIGDAVLSWRAGAKGFQPWFEPRALVEHTHEGTLRTYAREFFRRGGELARFRIESEGWSRARSAAAVVLSPLVVVLELARTARWAFRARWGGAFVATLPAQAVFRVAWCLGEASVHARSLGGGSPVRRLRATSGAP